MRWLSAILVILLSASPALAEQKQELLLRLDGWDFQHQLGDNGETQLCSVGRMDDDDIAVGFTLSAKGSLVISVDGTALPASVSQADVEYILDGSPVSLEVSGQDHMILGRAQLPGAGAIFDRLQTGQTLEIRTPAKNISIPLYAFNFLMSGLLDCIQGNPTIHQLVKAPLDETKLAVSAWLKNDFKEEPDLLPDSYVKEWLPDYDVAWNTKDGTIGAYALWQGVSILGLNAVTAHLIGQEASQCEENFSVAIGAPTIDWPNTYQRVVSTACHDGRKVYFQLKLRTDGLLGVIREGNDRP